MWPIKARQELKNERLRLEAERKAKKRARRAQMMQVGGLVIGAVTGGLGYLGIAAGATGALAGASLGATVAGGIASGDVGTAVNAATSSVNSIVQTSLAAQKLNQVSNSKTEAAAMSASYAPGGGANAGSLLFPNTLVGRPPEMVRISSPSPLSTQSVDDAIRFGAAPSDFGGSATVKSASAPPAKKPSTPPSAANPLKPKPPFDYDKDLGLFGLQDLNTGD